MGCVTVNSTSSSIASWAVGVRPICYRAAFFYGKHAQPSHWALYPCLSVWSRGGGVGLPHTCLPPPCSFMMYVVYVLHGCMRLPGHPLSPCVDLPATTLLLFLRTAVVAVFVCWGVGFCMRASSSPFDRSLARSCSCYVRMGIGFELCTLYSSRARASYVCFGSWVRVLHVVFVGIVT